MKIIKKIDMQKKPNRCSFLWKPIIYLLAFPTLIIRKFKLEKINMKGVKAPYLLLSNHHSPLDFKVMSRAIFPSTGNYIVALDGFYDYTEWLMRSVGCIVKRKFTNDIALIKKMKYSIKKNKAALVLYPEARYSLDGTEAILPESLGKMVKFLGVPVVTLNMRGTYIARPQWNKIYRKCPIEATMNNIITKDEINEISIDEINKRISEALKYDDFKYLKDKDIHIVANNRAEKLNKILYKCPVCGKEGSMSGHLNEFKCNSCGKQWEFNEQYELKALDGKDIFTHVPDWFKWEREEVRKEVRNHTYRIESDVQVETLPNAQKYYYQGKGHFVHDENGFTLTSHIYGSEKTITWSPLENYGVHIEYDFRKFGDALDISKLDESYWIYPIGVKDIISKISMATEEIYIMKKEEAEKMLAIENK